MATGGFKSSPATDFLEEWKAKREKMRAKMLGDIAAATGAPLGAPRPSPPPPLTPPSPPSSPGTDYSSNPGNCHPSSSSSSLTRSSSGSALKRPEEDAHHTGAAHSFNPKKAPPQADKAPCAAPLLDLPPSSSSNNNMACNDSDKESPPQGKSKEKKSSGPSARKGKGQIEKRKLREKRRSTGVVSIPSNESLDELGIDDASEKERREEEELVQANTSQNEAMTADPATGCIMDLPRSGNGRHKSSAQQGSEDEDDDEEEGGNSRQLHNHQGSLEKRIEELEKELARARQESDRLLNAHQDKDDLIGRLKEEIDLLNRDLDDVEDENKQLKQENKTLLKVVGQLTR